MAQLNPPRILCGGISREVYIVTHGKEIDRGDGTTYVDASRKYKATADFEATARELGWTPPEPKFDEAQADAEAGTI